MDGRGGQAQAGGDAGRAEPLTAAQPEDALLEAGGGPPGAGGGDAGPVDHAGLAELLVAAPPAVGQWSERRPSRGRCERSAVGVGGDPPDQGQPSRRGQPGVSVGHEASSERGAVTARTSLGGLTSRQQPLWAEHLDQHKLDTPEMAAIDARYAELEDDKLALERARFRSPQGVERLPEERYYELRSEIEREQEQLRRRRIVNRDAHPLREALGREWTVNAWESEALECVGPSFGSWLSASRLRARLDMAAQRRATLAPSTIPSESRSS
jgi:hypothetical protein